MKEKLKDKKIIAGLVIGIIAIIGIIIFIVMSMNTSTLKLKNKEVTVEYGQPVSKELTDYLDFDKVDTTKKDDILAKAKLEMNIENESGKEYPAIGEYKATITYDKDKAEFTIFIKDTVSPTFKDFKDSVETAKDVKPDYTKTYAAEDLTQTTITCDDANVKYDTVGEYKATIKVADTSKNETSKEITVKVIEPTIKLDKESTSLYVKETLVLKATIVGKDEKATFKSSDDKIATVDENGKVTAKAKGTTTITASANGKDITCKITVKETPKGSSTTTKKDPSGNNVTVVTPPNNNSSSGGSGSSNQSSPKTSREAFNLINAERQKLGLSPAVWDSECERIALIRAKQIQSDFSHNQFVTDFQNSNHKLSECLAMQDFGNFPPSVVVKGWMNSKAHKNILMGETRTKLAVAYMNNRWVAVNSR